MEISHLSLVITALFCASAAFAETVLVESPDGHPELTIEAAVDALAGGWRQAADLA